MNNKNEIFEYLNKNLFNSCDVNDIQEVINFLEENKKSLIDWIEENDKNHLEQIEEINKYGGY